VRIRALYDSEHMSRAPRHHYASDFTTLANCLQRATDVLKEPALLRGCPLPPASQFSVTAQLLARLEVDVARCVEADWLQAPAMDAVRHNAGEICCQISAAKLHVHILHGMSQALCDGSYLGPSSLHSELIICQKLPRVELSMPVPV
jgi:hypothetical protein